MKISDELRNSVSENMMESLGTKTLPRTDARPNAKPDHLVGTERISGTLMIPIDRIVRDPHQPREDFDEEAIQKMANTISVVGVLQPIRVRWDKDQGVYVIIAGENRWRAATLADQAKVPCIVVQTPSERILTEQLVENCRRSDLNPMEKAFAFHRMMTELQMKQVEAADAIGYSESQFCKIVKLLDLPPDEQEKVRKGKISVSQALAGVTRRSRRTKAEMPKKFVYRTDKAEVTVLFKTNEATEIESRIELQKALDLSTEFLKAGKV